jgi:hypothetical protein
VDVNDLKQILQEKANLSPEQAEQAAQVAFDYVKEQIPDSEGLMQKAGDVAGDITDKAGDVAGDLTKKLGSIFNR